MTTATDENAFGVWLSYYDVEDDEYADDDTAGFVERFRAFRRAVLSHLGDVPLAEGARALSLGHGVFVEFEEGNESTPVMPWVRGLREALEASGFTTVAVLSHGSRWVGEDGAHWEALAAGEVEVLDYSGPSEPLRRALYADAATRPDDERPGEDWGPGFYVDTEAIEALGKTPKNAPTVLRSGGAGFYRVSR